MRCERVDGDLPGLVDGRPLPEPARRHVEHCLRCQAATSRDRRVHRALHDLGDRTRPPPPGLYAEIVSVLDSAASVPPHPHHRRRVAYVGTLAAATAAGVGGALVLAARGRRLAG